MNAESVAMRLLTLDSGARYAVITNAVNDYFKILYSIASDIYDSCIEEYYFQYTPTVYNRHGNIEGFNLYNANEIAYSDLKLQLKIDSGQLLPYKGKGDKREKVLSSVMSGLRGGKLKHVSGWPKSWRASYPNRFSRYGGVWSSSEKTMYTIYDDFVDNVIKDTKDLFWTLVSQKI